MAHYKQLKDKTRAAKHKRMAKGIVSLLWFVLGFLTALLLTK